MPRVREITLDGVTVKISPLSMDEADKFMAENKELRVRDPKPTPEDWDNRTIRYVCFTLNKAAKASSNGNGSAEEFTPEKVRDQFDRILLNRVFFEFAEMSGLTLGGAQGEAAATSTSR
jgi:hypothetical protein